MFGVVLRPFVARARAPTGRRATPTLLHFSPIFSMHSLSSSSTREIRFWWRPVCRDIAQLPTRRFSNPRALEQIFGNFPKASQGLPRGPTSAFIRTFSKKSLQGASQRPCRPQTRFHPNLFEKIVSGSPQEPRGIPEEPVESRGASAETPGAPRNPRRILRDIPKGPWGPRLNP